MRLIEAAIPSGRHDEILAALDEQEYDYVTVPESSREEYSELLMLPVETNEVEEVLDILKKYDVEKDAYVVVTELSTIVSEEYEGGEDPGEDDEGSGDERISRDELKAKAEDLSRSTTNYVLFTVISAVVATAGLMMDSAAIVVGSMVIAPLIGPTLASSVATVVNDDDLFREGMKSQWLGVAVAIASSIAFAFLVRFTIAPDVDLMMIQQVAERSHPGLLVLAVALGAGVAGALSLTSGMSAALVGVMIAVALIPPAAAVGLGVAYGNRPLAIGAGVLVFLNVLCINLAALVTLWAKGYRPEHWYEERIAKQITVQRVGALTLLVLALTSFLVAVSYDERQNSAFEATVEGEIEALDVDIIDVEFSYEAGVVFQSPRSITVYVDERRSGLASDIQTAIREETGHSPEVVVVRQDREIAR